MTPHLLNESELVEWMNTRWEMYATDGRKRLEINFDGLFRVKDATGVIYLGDDRTDAVLAYNGAR